MPYGYKIYFTERIRNRVVRWDPDAGTATVVAGGEAAPAGDQGQGQSLDSPYGIAMDAEGHLVVADKHHHRLARLQGRLRDLPTRDGTRGRPNRFPDRVDAPGLPTGLWSLGSEGLLVTYSQDGTIYRVDRKGELHLVLGLPIGSGFSYGPFQAEATPAEALKLPLGQPVAAVQDRAGNVLFIERNFQCVRVWHPQRGLRTLFALSTYGQPVPDLPVGTRQAASALGLQFPTGLTTGPDGAWYVADGALHIVLRIDPTTNQAEVIYHSQPRKGYEGGGPGAIALGPDGTLWVLDYAEGGVRGVAPRSGRWERSKAQCSSAYDDSLCHQPEGAGLVTAPN